MAKTTETAILVGYGVLCAFAYLGLILVDAIRTDASQPTLGVAFLLLTLCVAFGGGPLLLYSAFRRQGRFALPLRSLGVSASLGTLLGAIVVAFAIASEPGPLARFAIPVYTLQVSLGLCLLWLQTFPVTSPTARHIVNAILVAPCLAAPLATYIVLSTDPLQTWLTALSLGWLPMLLAQPRLRQRRLDLRVRPASRDPLPDHPTPG